MASLLQNLGKPEYLHVLLNHIPLAGLLVAAAGLLLALAFRNEGGTLICLLLVALSALAIWPVIHFGEAAADRVSSMLYLEGQGWLDNHRHLARAWSWVYYVAGGAAVFSALSRRLLHRLFRPFSWITLIFAILSLVAGSVIAEAGGKLRHKEFRNGPPPAVNGDTAHEQT